MTPSTHSTFSTAADRPRPRLVTPLLPLALAALVAAAEPVAAQGQGQGQGKVKFEFDEAPLQSAIDAATTTLMFKNQNSKKCQDAMASGNQQQIDKFCKGPGLVPGNPNSQGKMNSNGKMVGRRIKTMTTVGYENPRQKGRNRDFWEPFMVDATTAGSLGAQLNAGVGKGRRGRAVLFAHLAVNDDRDCDDTVTGEHLGGLVPPGVPIADGEPGSCFDAAGNLLQTLSNHGPDGCVHVTAGFIAGAEDSVEDPCYDESNVAKLTSLVERIDEDGPDGDNDGDGRVDEDPAEPFDPEVAPINDDNDCLDLVTGVIVGGPGVPDGDSGSCFDASGALRTNLDFDPADPNTCEHLDSDTLLTGDPLDGVDDFCYDAEGNPKTTTLAELIDEDGDLAIDQDGDGETDEDPPLDFATACALYSAQLGLPAGDLVDGDTCDLTRAFVVHVNNELASALENDPKFKGGKFFKVDDQGNPDPTVEDGVMFGEEARSFEIEEVVDLTCPAGMILIEEEESSLRECVDEVEVEQAAASGALQGAGVPANFSGGAVGTGTIERLAMMGFTFAPPSLEWEYKIEEEACVLGVCAEVFFARVGYEFSVGLGLRLPVKVHVSNVPLEPYPPLAERDLIALDTELEPLNFTVADFEEFCDTHNLGSDPFIDCDEFGFPNFVEELSPISVGDSDADGDEFVARITAEAGVEVRALGVPLIDWSLGIDNDFAEMCTYWNLRDSSDIIGHTLANKGNFKQALQDLAVNCGSFTTPFGLEPDPTAVIPGTMRLRSFPFDLGDFDIRADCVEALARGETINVGGRILPRCTGLVLGVHGASLGVGLGITLEAGSQRITADLSTSGDVPGHTQQLVWEKSNNEEDSTVSVDPLLPDNYDGGPFQDDAVFTLSDFEFLLNSFQIRLRAILQFGGILSPIPDVAQLTIYNMVVDTNEFGIPIPQHPGTEDPEVGIFVENYALTIDVAPDPADPNRVDDDILMVEPGTEGRYQVSVRNVGSRQGSFDNFGVELSNEIQPGPGFTFVIDPDNDDDGLIDEDPFGPDGLLAADRDDDGDGIQDEDPVDVWEAFYDGTTIDNVPAHTDSTDGGTPGVVTLTIIPFRYATTAPGLYPFRVSADSVEAKALDMDNRDASRFRRRFAYDVGFVQVTAFFEPVLAIQPDMPTGKPGVLHELIVEATNMGNDPNNPDVMSRETEFLDFNQAGCTLVTMGKDPVGCPYRAVPTVIPADEWTTIDELSPEYGPLQPLGSEQDTFTIQPNREWAGMTDTVYEFETTLTSLVDPSLPPAEAVRTIGLTVTATTESMTRYIGLEIRELIEEIEAANAAGIKTGGLLPISMYPAEGKNNRALAASLVGNLVRATRIHRSNIKVMEGFVHALDGFNGKGNKIPPELDADWHARAAAILEDLAVASVTQIPSAP